ncbi:cation-transporting P-type ATPase [Clostridium uliginosum]|uniref:ATPase, P-type (Transporting), HAD superfamily, subfamily IC n=1 Tax=Clostridium uliginosum TaxID=119641 RepID=A0A1I1KMN5_9CLOT|nr:cation-transporting P-type ATPase [Clostridium uliginosum]SFC62204.1 ATPase, P-type (transporting), HAD superfamily, subfamily IC [Clostridium uliginosum]
MNKYCNNAWIEVVEMLNSDQDKGLNSIECDARREKYGTNKIDLPSGNRISRNIINIIKQVHIIIYLIITILLFMLKANNYKYIILAFLIINIVGIIGYNIKRDKEIGILEKLNFATSIVIRDGIEQVIKSEEILIGDIVKFKKDSAIPADIRIIKAIDIKVDEKNITGETFYKEKFESKISGSINSLGEMNNILFKGSLIKAGEGEGIVISTGNSTQLGKLLAMLTYASNRKHTLGDKLQRKWGKYLLIYFAILIVSVIFFINKGKYPNQLASGLFVLGCFPISVTSVLAFKCILKKFSNQDIHIINFSIIDLINDINIIFLDKIGAITKEQMVVNKIFTNDEIIYSKNVEYTKNINIQRIIDISLLCNNSIYNVEDKNAKGDLTEIAYLQYAAKKQIYKSILDNKNQRITEIPMDSDKKMLTILDKMKKGYRANARGNLDSVLERCTHIMIDGLEKELNEEDKIKIKDIDIKFSIEGLITQAFAYRNFSYEPSTSENIESNMVFVGIIALDNPLQDSIEEKIREIKDNGIVPILFTEENKVSAITTAKKAKIIFKNEQVVSGIELDSLNEQELKDLLGKVRVFSRINPEIKSQIISFFNKDGYKVAAAGETLGDLPSLNLSNVGIAKGNPLLIVKKVSDVYIKENYLEGFFKIKDFSRKFFDNVNRTFQGIYTIVLAELMLLLVSMIGGCEDVLGVFNIIFINVILFVPLSLILVLKEGRSIRNKEMIGRAVILLSSTIFSTYIANESAKNLIALMVLSIGSLLFITINSNISFRRVSIERRLVIISSFLIGLAISAILLTQEIILTKVVLINLGITIISLVVFEILFKRWQNSLMR